MAVQGSSNENSGTRDLYTGLENFKIVAVNPPTAEAYKQYGFNFDKDPVYLTKEKDDNGTEYTQLRVDFILDNDPAEGEPEIKLPVSYYIDSRTLESSTGKTQFTNKYGQFTWLESIENIPSNMNWFNLDGVRKSFRGEEALMGMIRNFCNVAKGGECYIENPAALFVGNVAEIREYITAFTNNKIKMLLVIRNSDVKDENGIITGSKQYQAIYTRKTERPYSTDFSFLKKDIDEWTSNGGGGKLEIPEAPFTLKKWEAFAPDENVGETSAANAW